MASQVDWNGLMDRAETELNRQMKVDDARLFGDSNPYEREITPSQQRDLYRQMLDPTATPAQRSFAQDVINRQFQKAELDRQRELTDG